VGIYHNVIDRMMTSLDSHWGGSPKAMLVTPAYAQSSGSELLVSDLPPGSEITGGSYVQGGVALANYHTGYDAGAGTWWVSCDDVAFPSFTATVGGIIFYEDGGTPETSYVKVFDKYASPVDVDGTTFTHTVGAGGIFRLALPS
jgi:hypothetical protein